MNHASTLNCSELERQGILKELAERYNGQQKAHNLFIRKNRVSS
jgi:hypothetical protein